MKNLNRFILRQILSPVIHFPQICSFSRSHVGSFWNNMDLFHHGGTSSYRWSCVAETISDGHMAWIILIKRTFSIYELSAKGRIRRLIFGLFLIFNSAFVSFCIDIAPDDRGRLDAELISLGSGEIGISRDSVSLYKTSAYRVPFFLRRNLILIEARVEEKKGLLLLDSGMDHVVLNHNHFKGELDVDNIIGVMGDMGSPQRKYVSMTIGDLPTHKQYALIADLNHFEQIFHAEILGVCGVDFLQQFQWVIHYPQRFIDFYPLDKSGDVVDHSLSPPNEVLALEKEAHLLIVKARSEGHTMNLALDTGSSSTILEKDNKVFLAAHHANLEQLQQTSMVIGINGKRKLITSFALSDLRVGSTVIPPLQVSFISLTRIIRRGNISLDGIFNPIFMCHSTIGINWIKKRLYVWQYPPKSQESFAGNLDQ